MAVTVASICNMALARVAAKGRVSDITSEDSNEAYQCNLIYDHLRRLLFASFNWNFATAYDTLSDLGNPPDGWSYQYMRPNQMLRMRELYAGGAQLNIVYEMAFVDSVYSILTNEEAATVKYVTDVTSPSEWPPLFIEALVNLLAFRLCVPLQRSQKMQNEIKLDFFYWVGKAEATDVEQSMVEFDASPVWITDR